MLHQIQAPQSCDLQFDAPDQTVKLIQNTTRCACVCCARARMLRGLCLLLLCNHVPKGSVGNKRPKCLSKCLVYLCLTSDGWRWVASHVESGLGDWLGFLLQTRVHFLQICWVRWVLSCFNFATKLVVGSTPMPINCKGKWGLTGTAARTTCNVLSPPDFCCL